MENKYKICNDENDFGEAESAKESDDNESTSFSNSNPKLNARKNAADLRQPRQKFCLRWEKEFPWLKADSPLDSLGYCNICEKQLVCKRSHLIRHEQSFRHLRLKNCAKKSEWDDVECSERVPKATEFLECSDKRNLQTIQPKIEEDDPIEPQQEYQANTEPIQQQRFEICYNVEEESEESKRQLKSSTELQQTSQIGTKKKLQSRLKLLRRIEHQRIELNNFFNMQGELTDISAVPNTAHAAASRDSIDLFFDSVSASVKALPPQLGAELKSRVADIVTEYELRALCEKETLETDLKDEKCHTYLIAPTDLLSTDEFVQEATMQIIDEELPQILYTFEAK